ncbi:hypothetical protein MKW98_022169 [Papaver atlanticum]|uniref:Uncharacterized protein n=1 Tax=Papaver atlanticum TaxID=357466 RepID=A0AAD4XR77_9MAGN|nr:hypothetical protein MKW98_022169 [Papaver atlanticum]
MKKLLLVGLSCANPSSIERPTMRRVLQILNDEAEVIRIPKVKPSLSFCSILSLSLDEIVSDEECDEATSSLPSSVGQVASECHGSEKASPLIEISIAS